MTDARESIEPLESRESPALGSEAADSAGGGRQLGWLALGAVLMLTVTVGFGALLWTIAKPPGAQHLDYVIPAGTDMRITTLEKGIDLIPSEIRIRKGGTVTLINEDIVSFQFGTLSVGPGQTITKRFQDVGTFRNTCRLTPGQEVVITVY